jgi:dihydrofolate reductase
MRKVVASLFISLDGVAESPDQWQFDVFTDDMGEELIRQMSEQDALLLGRVSYEAWASYWPTSTEEPFASLMNKTPKYVVSNTLEKVAWGEWNTVSLLKGNFADEIRKLKNQLGKNIGVGGSISLVQSLLQLNLLDELHLQVHPVIVGHGKRLFTETADVKRLTLTQSKITSTGVVMLSYARHS